MSEGVGEQISSIPGEIKNFPFLAIGIGLLFLFLVLLIEAYKPGLLTGPIKNFLGAIGVKGATA